MRSLLVAGAIFTVSYPAMAQQSSADALASLGIKLVEPLSPKALARTQAAVAAELAKVGATSFFENISDVNGGRVRHRTSGLVCPLGKKGQHILTASDEGASCETRDGGAVYKTIVERAPSGATTDSVAAAALAHAQRQPGYSPREGLVVTARAKSASQRRPEHRTLHYFTRVRGAERAHRIQVGLVRGWILTEQRETKRERGGALASDLLSEVTFGLSMRQR